MSYVDWAIGLGFFLFFTTVVIGLSVIQFAKVPAEVTIEEYREKAIELFEDFFSTSGTPGDWEVAGVVPSELGLIKTIYKVPITVEEPGTGSRIDEPVIVKLFFDDECLNKTWNNTIRLYDANLNEQGFELVNPVNCSSQFLNESYMRFKVNLTQNEEKLFNIYFSDDVEISASNYTLNYSTSSWVPASGDNWTETTDSLWSRYGGSSATPATNATIKMRGAASIQIKDAFDNEKLGLKYQPAAAVTGVSNGWYIDAWIYVDDLSGVSAVNVSVSESSDTIVTSISSGIMDNEAWYHFEKGLSASEWEDWNSFDASSGIDNITFYMLNSSADITRQLKVDEMHFELRPLQVKTFPQEEEVVISSKKITALDELSYAQLIDVIGEDYQFRVEIVE